MSLVNPKVLPIDERPNPIRERIGRGMFTDREDEMAALMQWTDMVSNEWEKSMALVSHRRHGKTAILERFYNRLFWERDDIIPFYYELHGNNKTFNEFVKEYFLAFQQQFLAYRVREPSIAFNAKLNTDDLYQLAVDAGEESVQNVLDKLPYYEGHTYYTELFKLAQRLPHQYAIETDLSVIVMFDEFQRLNQVLYFDDALTQPYGRLTGSFSSVVESPLAPMLIAGSQVTVLSQQALSKGMAGRVSSMHIERMPMDGGAELARKMASQQRIDLPIELAYSISRITKGHPFYIWALFHSHMPGRDLSTEQNIQTVLKFELEDRRGHINEFWREHFAENMAAIDEINAKRMIFYLMQNPERDVPVDEMVENVALTISKEDANRKLRELVWVDMIEERSSSVYGGLSDPMLGRVLRIEYAWDLQQGLRAEVADQVQAEFTAEALAAKDELIASLRGQLSNWLGRMAEVFIERLMKRFFVGQTVEGDAYFNVAGQVQLPRFSRVYPTVTQPEGATRAYQIDIYAEPKEAEDPPWIIEVKNWTEPVSKAVVEKFLEAAQNLADERKEAQFVRWFYARSGFSKPARTLLEEEAILFTDQAGLARLLKDFQVVEKWAE